MLQTFKTAPSYFVNNAMHGKTGKKLVADDEVAAFVQTQSGRVLFTPSGAYIGMGMSDRVGESMPEREDKRIIDEAPET